MTHQRRTKGMLAVALGWLATSGCTGNIDGGEVAHDAPGAREPGPGGTASGPATQGRGGTAGTPGLQGGGATPGTGAETSPAVGGGSIAAACANPTAEVALVPARVWLLSDSQYVNAVQDLFGVTLPPDITRARSAAAANFSEVAVVSAQTASSFGAAAAQAAQGAAPAVDKLVSCATRDDACAERFIRDRVARAFRRPLADAEVQALLTVYRAGAADGFASGIQLVLETVLQAPSFLYRTELGGTATGGRASLTATELASALSLTLIDSVPDDPLWQKAVSGALTDPAVFGAEVDRLLATPRAQSNLTGFASYWLDLDKLATTQKDPKAFKEFTSSLRDSLSASLQRSVEDALLRGKVSDLLTSNRLYVDTVMAPVYGVPKPTAPGQTAVDLPAAERGGGLLTHPGMLTALSKPGDTDVVHRGLFVYERLACVGTIPAPGQALQSQIAQVSALPTEAARAQARAGMAACAGCHANFDPLGLALENYDPIGRYRTMAAGMPIVAAADVKNVDPGVDGHVVGAIDLARRLVDSNRVNRCALAQFAQGAFGMQVGSDGDICALRGALDRLNASGKFLDMVKGFLTTRAFALRAKG